MRLQAQPLGDVARQISGENELWLATALTNAALQVCFPFYLSALSSLRMCSSCDLAYCFDQWWASDKSFCHVVRTWRHQSWLVQ